MRSPIPSTVAILTFALAGPALAEEPSEAMASPEALAALEAGVQVLQSRMDRELAALIEQKVGVSVARHLDENFREIAALSPASAPRKLVPAAAAQEDPDSNMVCAFEDGDVLGCRLIAARIGRQTAAVRFDR